MAEPHELADCPACGTELSVERESRGLCPSCLVELAIDVPDLTSDPCDLIDVEPSNSSRRNGSS